MQSIPYILINELNRIVISNSLETGTVITALHFLCNLPMGQLNWSITYTSLKRFALDKLSSLRVLLISYEK
jgi:hypothetical protein